ncbi:fimbrial protein [Paraburkholderia jirisanensis]
MNARVNALTEHAAAEYFVFASADERHAQWLAGALAEAGALEQVALDATAFVQRIAAVNPSLVFVDFSGGRSVAAAAAVQAARAASPGLQVIAVGSVAEPDSALAALRAGVRDFIDLSASPQEAHTIARQVIDSIVEPMSRQGRLTVLLGARVGMGVTTLAANLAVLLQQRGAAHKREALLFDLGLPASDGTLLLDTESELHFVEAVRNLRRFDHTFVHTALSHHTSGLAVTTLPPDLAELRQVSYAASIGLLNRLRAFFDQQIVDLGGFPNSEFIGNAVQAADETWLVCDQSVASIVSAAAVLETLEAGVVDRERLRSKLRLVVSKHDRELGLDAQQIAQRLNLELLATLPERRVALGRAANQGQLLAETTPRDPYVRALDALMERLDGMPSRAPASRGAAGPADAARARATGPDAAAPRTAASGTASGNAAAPGAAVSGTSTAAATRVLGALRRFIPTSNKRS